MVHSSTIDQLINLTGGKFPNCSVYVHEGVITRELYEARKAERQGKPSWDDAPKWANWLMQDGSGFWLWFELRPSKYWVVEGGKYLEVNDGEVIGDYRNTLEQRPNHIGESDEKPNIDFELTAASVHPGLGGKLLLDKVMQIAGNAFAKHAQLATEECFALMREAEDKPGNSADWYDYGKQEATKLPPVGAVVNFEWGGYHLGAVEIVAYRNNGNTAVLWHVDRDAPDAAEVMSSSFRPLDWNRNLQPEPEPEPSPELSFHLSNAFNELQASARLLPEDDPRRAQIVALAGGVGAVKEVA